MNDNLKSVISRSHSLSSLLCSLSKHLDSFHLEGLSRELYAYSSELMC